MNSKAHYIVTGAAGVLGRAVAEELMKAGASVTGLGRRAMPIGFRGGWSQCDLTNRESVSRTLADADAVIHCASTPLEPDHHRATIRNLITAAKERGSHITYVSICSMESAAPYNGYYRAKLTNETNLEDSGVSFGIVRIAQFHPFVARIVSRLVLGPLVLAPKLRFQSIDVGFAAEELAKFAMNRTQGRTPDVPGPDVLTETELVPSWLTAKAMKKIILPVPRLGTLKQLGRLEPVSGISGGKTWSQWLAKEAHSPSPYTW